MFDIEDYNYELPQRLIAQVPVSTRDHSRLLLVDRKSGRLTEDRFFNLPGLLRRGDLLVVNNTQVVPARLFGRKASGGRVEILVLEHPNKKNEVLQTRTCLLKSSKRPKIGSLLFFDAGMTGVLREVLEDGLVRIEFRGDRSIDGLLEKWGHMPLPPYIRREQNSNFATLDRTRYQTVFARSRGAVAAPTAGLHFSEDLIEKLKTSGINLATLTLHVGHGTFRPVRVKDIRDHNLGEEYYCIAPGTAEAISATKKAGGRIVAVGTTVVRTLETAADKEGMVTPGQGKTNLMVTPGFFFKVVDAIITNFHLPKSSLLFLVSAFAGQDLTKKAYKLAVEKEFRFYSYGDAMLIL